MKRMRFLSLMIAALTLSACGSGSNDAGDPTVAERAAESMGGLDALQAVQTQMIVSSGQRFEAEQTVSPGGPSRNVSNFNVTLARDLNSGRFRFDWGWDISYPFVVQRQYADVVNGDQGFVDGQDSPASPLQAPMPSARVATISKLHKLSDPLLLIRSAVENPADVESRPDEIFQGRVHNVMALPDGFSPIRIFVDSETSLPSKADTFEDDPYYGDTLYEVIYDDWRQVGSVVLPFQLTHRLDGRTVHTEVRSSIQNNAALAANIFDIPPAMQVPFDANDALRGKRMSQWFLRRQVMGGPDYRDLSLNVVFTDIGQAAPGVFFVAGVSHNTLVVEMADHLIAVEAPLYEERSQAVIREAKARFPNKPFRFVVNTHFHIDHGGGIRAYASEGATVVVGEASRARFQEVFLEPHALRPDSLELNPRTVPIQGVLPGVPVTIASDGVRTVQVVPVASGHASDMVIAFIPEEGLVFESDLFSPTGDFTLTDLPPDLVAAFNQFGLAVRRIAGGHNSTGLLLP